MSQIRIIYTRLRFGLPKTSRSGSPRLLSTFASPHLAGEEPDFYGVGGFHRVALGDTFDDGRYRILRKLGYGQYSTVWLARDSKHQRYVALKIPRADCYGGPERVLLSKITETCARSKHEGRHFILPVLHQFKHAGPNGVHVCFVFDVLGHHLYFQCSKYEDGRLPVRSVKLIARQLLLGLDFLHTECGVVHTATCRHEHHSHKIQPPALRAPEVTIGAPWDAGVDIWSVGCLIVEFMQGIVLFSGQESKHGDWTADDDRLARTIEVLGAFPAEFLKKGNRTREFFNEHGTLRRIANLNPTTLESIIDGQESPFLKPNDMPHAEVPIFIDFLKGMLAINPDHRRSAAELLRHGWLKQ
ncbi:serine kinase [Histoplasma capsulatum]|uniref:non-specific serine/threonine protein kinase n=1 Tax=Ajellomyces capsulatus TaxID=5037 RepID=A0A8A1MDQ7_AJECA|nr:serine kinase [Histoplasma capsulatum]